MGDRCYARVSVPLSALSTTKRRRALAAAFGLTLPEINVICRQDPSANEPTAGYGNDTILRLVSGVPCVVLEDEHCNHGGSLIEDDLQAAGIPFLRFHLAGSDYGPGRAAFSGRGHLEWIDCDKDSNPLIRVDVINGTAVIDPGAIDSVNQLLAAERSVLHWAQRRPRTTKPRSRKFKS